MKRRIPGLSQAALPTSEVPDGLYLVKVERIQYRWDKQKPYYAVRFTVCQPKPFVGTSLPARLYATPKALWKLAWFLRDFGYDSELLGRDELDEKRLVGLDGVVKVSHTTVNGRTISDQQRREFGQLVEDTISQVEAAQFLPRPGIRFPQNGCTSCPYLGLCLRNQPLIDAKLLRRPGGDVGWLNELEY